MKGYGCRWTWLFNIRKNSAFIAVLHVSPQLSIYSKSKYPLSLFKLGPISKLTPPPPKKTGQNYKLKYSVVFFVHLKKFLLLVSVAIFDRDRSCPIWFCRCTTFERIGPTFARQKIHDWTHFTVVIYLRKKIKIIKLLRNYYKNDL